MTISKIPNPNGTIDAPTGSLTGINIPHAKAHERIAFISDFVDETLADTETIILAFKTPAGLTRVHMLFEFNTLVGGGLRIWEGPTWDNQSGALNPIINRFRETAPRSSIVLEDRGQIGFVASDNIITNPTNLVTAGATLLHHLFAWGKKEKIQAGGARDSDELVLATDTQYAAVFTADGGSNKAQVFLNWYEQLDGS